MTDGTARARRLARALRDGLNTDVTVIGRAAARVLFRQIRRTATLLWERPSADLPDEEALARSRSRRLTTRVLHLAVFWFAIWPFVAVLMGSINLMEYPTTRDVPFSIAFPGIATGVLYLIPEFLVSGAILFLVSSAVFVAFPPGTRPLRQRWVLEPAIAYIGLCLGIALEFPAVLNNAFFWPLRKITLWEAYIALVLTLAGLALSRQGTRPQWRRLARATLPAMVFVAFGWGLTQIPVPGSNQPANRNATVLLGIDSLSTSMAIEPLRNFAKENGGAFYEHAVTPGLLTNAVWTAILEHRPVHETGVLLTFQSPDWSRSPYQLVREAQRRGFQTWSFVTSQNTAYIGTLAGFDHDRSGPMGWLQDATSAAKNGSVLVPFVVSRLPQLPFSHIAPNQAGTYAYDLRANVRTILSAHQGPRPVLTIGHLEYLHDEAYPRFADLPKNYRSAVLGSRVDSLRDFGGDWQLPRVPGDRINLLEWKIGKVQAVVTDEVRRSGFLEEQNHNRLILLSDHGQRSKLNSRNFGSRVYYEVPLITFGLPVRDLQQPISLLDIPSLIGLDDPSMAGPAAPVVEYANIPSMEEFRRAILGADWLRDGRINIKPDFTQRYLRALKAYRPPENGEPAGAPYVAAGAGGPSHPRAGANARPAVDRRTQSHLHNGAGVGLKPAGF